MKKNFLLITAYLLLVATTAAQFYFNQYYLCTGFLIAILCTISTGKSRDTFVVSGVSFVALTTYTLVHLNTELLSSLVSQYVFFVLSICLTAQLVLFNKRSKKHNGKNFEELESLFNYATIGIVITNNRGRITNFNKYAEHQFGYKKEEVMNQLVELLIPKNVHPAHIKHRSDFHHHPEPRVMGEGRDLRAQKKDGTQFPVEISLSHYQIGDETFVIAFVIDIATRKKNEQALLKQKDELELTSLRIIDMNQTLESKVEHRTQMLKDTLLELEISKRELSEALYQEKELGDLKSRFVTIASHEFRTPLSTILSSADLLERYNTAGEDPQKRERHIQRIKNSVSGMKSILEDFLSLGKLEEGFVKANMKITPPAEWVAELEDTIADLQQLAKAGQQIHFNHGISAPVFIDLDLLRNILVNLTSNAIKFSPENSPINVSVQTSPEEIILTVKDSGMGISDEDQQHLFERFFRARNASSIQGTGLGLHIVGKYVELMGGKIIMESTLDKGTSFSIVIPQSNSMTA